MLQFTNRYESYLYNESLRQPFKVKAIKVNCCNESRHAALDQFPAWVGRASQATTDWRVALSNIFGRLYYICPRPTQESHLKTATNTILQRLKQPHAPLQRFVQGHDLYIGHLYLFFTQGTLSETINFDILVANNVTISHRVALLTSDDSIRPH